MKIQKIFGLALLSSLIGCSGNSDSTDSNSDTTNVAQTDSTGEIDQSQFLVKTLPGFYGAELTTEPYIIDEMLVFIQSETNSGQNFSIVLSEDQEVYLEIGYDKTGLEESWRLDIAVENPFGLEAKLEFTDANHDDIKDELVIWWSKMDGTSGIMDGYESENKGVIIFDVLQREVLLNLLYSHHYSTYSASSESDINNPDFHAKMDEKSEWSTCNYWYDLALNNGDVTLTNYVFEKEGQGECGPSEQYQEGTYSFNNSNGQYELKQ